MGAGCSKKVTAVPVTRPTRLDIVLLGATGVGKSALLRRYTAGAAPDPAAEPDCRAGPQLTTHKATLKDGWGVSLNIWDTSGRDRHREFLAAPLLSKAAVVVVVYDVTAPATLEDAAAWGQEVAKHCRQAPQPVVMLVGNKADLHEQRHLETAAAAHAQATREGARHVEVSALTGDGVEDLFSQALEAAAGPPPGGSEL